MKTPLIPLFMLLSCAANAQDILILGEIHDNPVHHERQAEMVSEFAPAAIVFEMLTVDQADGWVVPADLSVEDLEEKLQWAESGWLEFSMYAPIFMAGSDARFYGAGLPREQAMTALSEGIVSVFGAEADAYGLDTPLDEAEQQARENLQFAAHCDALPKEMLPGMVDIQRLRDAKLARAAVKAFNETGGPVAVITGNGHARRDWGVPAYLERVAPELDVKVIGQTEENAPLSGEFDIVLSAPAIDRPDPCDAFKS